MIKKRKEYESKDRQKESSDMCIDCLIEHFVSRRRVLDNIFDANKTKAKGTVVKPLSKDEKNAMEYLFDYLIQLRTKEVINDRSDECLKYINKAKNLIFATRRDADWDQVIKRLRQAIKKQRIFNIPLFLKHYKEQELSCQSLKNENIALFIGSTGAGKSTTIYFLNGVEMEKDRYGHICPKKGAAISEELSNVKLQQSHRESVTMDITPIPVLLQNDNSNNSNNNNNSSTSTNNKNDSHSNNNNTTKSKILFCDTPGLGDSRGDEIDIANTYGLINAMKCAQSVRIVFVISKEDMSQRMKECKILAHNLYQYLRNYNVDTTDNKDDGNNSDGDSDHSDDSDGDSDDDRRNDDGDVSVDANFLEKLNDISIVFTKFPSVESIKNVFSDKEIRRWARKNTSKHGSAFYYLNKHINKLVNSDKIILIDPINGNFKASKHDIFMTNDAKWIKACDANFQAYIAPDKMFRIKQQVVQDIKYVKRIIETNKNVRGVGNFGNFDYFGYIQCKINQLSELNKILGIQCGDIIEKKLHNCNTSVTDEWNRICDEVLDKVVGSSELRIDQDGIDYYQSCTHNVERVMHHLLTKYMQLGNDHLSSAMTKDKMIERLHYGFKRLLSEVKFINSEHSENDEKLQPQENRVTTSDMKSSMSNLFKCLIIVKHFGNDWNDYLNGYLNKMYDQCSKSINENEFKYVVYMLELLGGTIGKIGDLKIQFLQDTPQWEMLRIVSNDIKEELKRHLDLQVETIEKLVKAVNKHNHKSKHEPFETRLTNLKQKYCILSKCSKQLEHCFIYDTSKRVKTLLNGCCESMESKINGILAELNNSINTSHNQQWDLDEIRDYVHVMDWVMRIDTTFTSTVNKDAILTKIIIYLEKVSSIKNVNMILSEMKWIIKYHSSKSSLGTRFESILSSKINDLNEYVKNDAGICLSPINTCQKAVQEIVDQIILAARCYHDARILFDGVYELNVTEIAKPVDILRDQITQLFDSFIGLNNESQKQTENKTEEKDIDNSSTSINISDEQANKCVQLLEMCKSFHKKHRGDGDSGPFNTEIMLLTKGTQSTIEKYMKKIGSMQCNHIVNGLKYFEKLVNNLNAYDISNNDLSDVNNHAKNITLFGTVRIRVEKYDRLSEYLYVNQDVKDAISQWKTSIKHIYDKLDQIIPKSYDSAAIISSSMTICKSLTIVDSCGILEKRHTFASLREKIELLINEECKELAKTIDKRDFSSVSKQFKKQEKQLQIGGRYDYAREYLANEILTMTREMTNLIEQVPQCHMNEYMELRQKLEKYTPRIKRIMKLKLIKYVDENNKNKWNEHLKNVFVQAQSTAGELIKLSLQYIQQAQYDESQSRMEILNDFELKLMELNACQNVYHYNTSEKKIAELVDTLQQRLDEECTKFDYLSIEDFHSETQPSIICKILSNALRISNVFDNGVNDKTARSKKHYQESINRIEKSFQVVFEAECKQIVGVKKDFYQNSMRVDRCDELFKSLVDGHLKSTITRVFNEMKQQFDGLKRDEDSEMIDNVAAQSMSLMDRILISISTHRSSLTGLQVVSAEYSNRIKYKHDYTTEQLEKIILNRIGKEYIEIELYLKSNELFDVKQDCIRNFHNRIDIFKQVVTDMIIMDGIEQELRQKMQEIYDTAKIDIETCKKSIDVQFEHIETMLERCAFFDRIGDYQDKNITQLAIKMSRLLNGLTYFCSVMNDILPEKIYVNEIKKQILDKFYTYFGKWTDKTQKMIIENDFEGSIMYLETATLFANNEIMKQVKEQISSESILDKFTCDNISKMVQEHLKLKQREISDATNGLGIVNGGDTSQSMKMRMKKYEQLKRKLIELGSSRRMDKYLSFRIESEFYNPCFSFVSDEIKKAIAAIADEFKKPLKDVSFVQINHLFTNLDALAKVGVYLESNKNLKLTEQIYSVRNKILSKLQEIAEAASSKKTTLDEIKKHMICLQMAKHNLTDDEFVNVVEECMKNIIKIQKKEYGILELSHMFTKSMPISTSIAISQEEKRCESNDMKISNKNVHCSNYNNKYNNCNDSYWCKEIVNSFADLAVPSTFSYAFNKKYGKDVKDIDDALDKMLKSKISDAGMVGIDDKEKEALKKLYNMFDKQYMHLVNKYTGIVGYYDDQESCTAKLRGKIDKLRVKPINIIKNCTGNDSDATASSSTIIKLMAHVFCMWTLLFSQPFFEMKKKTDELEIEESDIKAYLRQPKATQILAIFKLFGLNGIDTITSIKPCLIEMKTGEGKSLVLAISACVIALLGFDVYCTCYGELLTQRDHSEFENLFIHLQIANKISYGTLDDIIFAAIDDEFNMNCVTDLISSTSNYVHETDEKLGMNQSNRKCDCSNTILLIDEVDVLFEEYHSFIPRAVKLKHNRISKLLDYVWFHHKTEPNDKINMEQIKKHDSYHDCKKLFGFWMPLIDKEIEWMIEDVEKNDQTSYIVLQDLIGYRNQDRITYEYKFGYSNIFTFYKEHEQKNISAMALEKQKGILLFFGCTIPALLPLKFISVAGVCGTLLQSEITWKDFFQTNYQIDQFTYIPTMFKENEFVFDENKDVHLVDGLERWCWMISNEIIKQTSVVRGNKRPVLVFFETNDQLQSFLTKCGNRKLSVLNEELTVNEKIKLIKNACRLNTITLCTRIFGRGSDFVVTDDRVNELGGPHVIQTFFSLDVSEEIQIKGRTARNGGNGSFSMILNIRSIKRKFGMNQKSTGSLVYKILNEKRQILRKESNQLALEKIHERIAFQTEVEKLKNHVLIGNKEGSLQFLLKLSNIRCLC